MNSNSEENIIEPTIYRRKEHSVSRNDIDHDALKIMYRLIRHGYKAYLVGGGVRDLLLDKEPKDFDIATDATPRKIKTLFRNCRIIGRRFKLAHIFFKDNKIIEVSTFRDVSDLQEEDENGETSMKPHQAQRDNNYGTEETDARRRDLTINGLFYDLSTFSIIDYVGGMDDLKNRTIKIIGDPKARFEEDPVRMIRAIRHAARSSSTLDKACKEAINKNHEIIHQASQVRVYEEIKKDLCSGSGLPILRLLSENSLLQHFIPELEVNDGELLVDGSFFSKVYARIDKTSSEEESNLTAILAAIGLFMSEYPDSTAPLHQQFEDKDEITDHIASCFIKFSVPRKEKERIEDLLILWQKVLSTPLEKLQNSNLERRRRIEELSYLLDWFNVDGEFDEKLELVKKAKDKRKTQTSKKRKTESKRPRQPRNKDKKPSKSDNDTKNGNKRYL